MRGDWNETRKGNYLKLFVNIPDPQFSRQKSIKILKFPAVGCMDFLSEIPDPPAGGRLSEQKARTRGEAGGKPQHGAQQVLPCHLGEWEPS